MLQLLQPQCLRHKWLPVLVAAYNNITGHTLLHAICDIDTLGHAHSAVKVQSSLPEDH